MVIFINTQSINTKHNSFAERYRVHFITYDVNNLIPESLRTYHPSSLRWIFYHHFLHMRRNHFKNQFRKVLACDVRDTAFQSNAFRLLPTNTSVLFATGEARIANIGDCAWNRGWVVDCFGQNILQTVADRFISCSGITIGSMNRMSMYIGHMRNVLLGKDIKGSFPELKFPSCERNGVDQGAHNVLIRQPYFDGVRILFADDGALIVNLQSYNDVFVTVDDKLGLLNDRSEVFAIVHQYDRNYALQMHYTKMYIPQVPWDQPEAEFMRNPVCKKHFDIVLNYDFLRGRCDANTFRTMSASGCCEKCLLDNKCSSFTFAFGICFFKSCSRGEISTVVEDIKLRNQSYEVKSMYGKGLVSAYLLH